MSITPLDFKNYTVAELRQLVKEAPANAPAGGYSKMRKAELIDWLVKVHNTEAVQTPALSEVAEAAKQISKTLSETVPPFVELLGQGLNDLKHVFTQIERQELNEAKFRGRYEGKSAVVQVRRKVVEGTVVDRVHRGTELLLVIRHSEGFQKHPRVTLHAAEDVLI